MDLEQVQKFHDQNALTKDPQILLRYQQASAIVSAAMHNIVGSIREGENISELCKRSDAFLSGLCKEHASSLHLECGIALPTTVAQNECISNSAPVESCFLAQGDLVKVEFGAHVDGYIATVAHSFVVQASANVPVTGKMADALVATELASRALQRSLNAGVKSEEIYLLIQSIARMFGCHPVLGIQSQQLKRYLLDGEKIFPGALDQKEEALISPFTLEAGDVLAVNLAFSTGEGRTQQSGKCFIYNRDVTKEKNRLKLQSSKALIERIDKEFGVFPFSLGMLFAGVDEAACAKAKLGLAECVSSGLLRVNPGISEKAGEFVAQTKFTFVVGHGRITEAFPCQRAHSQWVVQDEKIRALVE
jgi:curved DNA binding protein